MAPKRDVVVMMDFGSHVQRRENILKYRRVRYLVEKRVEVHERETGERILYQTQVEDVKAGRIEERIVRSLLKSDVVIGILSSPNLNVIYELAIRNLLRGEWILLVEGDEAEDALPLYLQDVARIRTDTEGGGEITKWIRKTAEQERGLFQFTGPLRSELEAEFERIISEQDGYLETGLQDALRTIEHEKVPGPEFPKYVQHLDLGEILSNWKTAYPYSIWRIQWKPKPRHGSYTRDLAIGQPTLFGANSYFAQMVLRAGEPGFPPDRVGPGALTLDDVRRAIERYVDKDAFRRFWSDLEQLADSLMENPEQFDYLGTRVETPLTFLDHPNPNFRNKSLMVCPMAVRVIGESIIPHVAYLLIVFVEVGRHRGAPGLQGEGGPPSRE